MPNGSELGPLLEFAADDAAFAARRHRMVEATIAPRGIVDVRVLRAMAEVPRHLFVRGESAELAYEDTPLPTGEGQTISQPYIVALMCQASELEVGDRVLEIGTGSGYAAAVLSQIAGEIQTMELHEGLATAARERLARLGYSNVQVHAGDGTRGWSAGAPYDAILVAAGSPSIPGALRAQLAEGGRLIIPLGDEESQMLVRVRRRQDTFLNEDLCCVRFVPLCGS